MNSAATSVELERTEAILKDLGVARDKVCIVGSYSLFLKGLRNRYNDIDLAFDPSSLKSVVERHRDRLEIRRSGTINFPGDIQTSHNRYRTFGLNDEELFCNDYSEFINGWRVARLELEFVHKLRRAKSKDRADIRAIEAYALKASDWDWGLVSRCAFAPIKGKSSSGDRRLSRRLIRVVREPKKITDYLARLLAKLRRGAALVPNDTAQLAPELRLQLTSWMPTGALLATQIGRAGMASNAVFNEYLTISDIDAGNACQSSDGERAELVKLLADMRKNGIISKYTVSIRSDGEVIDGVKRLACALYLDADNMPIKVLGTRQTLDLSTAGGAERERHNHTAGRIAAVREELCARFGVYFMVLLWPPVQHCFDEIESSVAARYRVLSSCNLDFDPEAFESFARSVYAIDDIAAWKVEVKLHAMRRYSCKVRCLVIDLPQPVFRAKADTSSYLSRAAVALKRSIRDEFKERVPNYIYDIICHIGDNHTHNRQIWRLMQSRLQSQV